MDFLNGIPKTDGWYLVRLVDDRNQPYDVDYCRAKSSSQGGGRE